ncbi:MAG: tetratricopeptide repeat protein [Candidatus Polarisedimenticolia bacterium]
MSIRKMAAAGLLPVMVLLAPVVLVVTTIMQAPVLALEEEPVGDPEGPPAVDAPPPPAPAVPPAPAPKESAMPSPPAKATPLDGASIAGRLERNPEDSASLNEYANRLVAGGRLEEAARVYRKVVRLAPQLAVAWNNLGVVEGALGNDLAAEGAYAKAIKAAPLYALARYNLGALHDVRGHYDAAIENYQRAIELDPGLLDVRRNPRIASNRHLPAILVKSYIDRGGSALLPVESLYPRATPRDPKKKKR